MRHLFSFMVVLLVCTVCRAVEPKEIAVSNLSMRFNTKIEQIYTFYGAGDFVINNEYTDCSPMKVSHTIHITGKRFVLDKGTENETNFNINSCTYTNGNVFADRGTMEIYRFSCNKIKDNATSSWTSIITVQKVKDGVRAQTIISIPSYDSDGVMCQNTILRN